jgi:DNA polymerase elongation subunit (family B)
VKYLALDIETAPAVVYTFSLFKPMIGLDQIIEDSRMICWSAQWHGTKNTMFRSEFHDGRDTMLEELHKLIDEADAVITYNGKSFDMPWIHGEFITEGFLPPSPYKHVDLYQTLKANSRFISRKLDFASQKLLGDRKTPHTGFRLWRDCLAGDSKAWALMKKYSIQDTKLMLPLFDILLPWIYNVPNRAVYDDVPGGCPACGGVNLERRGVQRTITSTFQRYQCQDCGKWSRGAKRIASSAARPI